MVLYCDHPEYPNGATMKIRKLLISIAIVVATLFAVGKILPLVIDAAYPRMRASTEAFSMQGVADGEYEGKAFLLPVSVEVKATVAGGRISSVELLRHFNGQGKPAEAIIGRVVEAQSLGVDVISGATHSSLTILKALENALEKGKKR
jgi:uncharacterized protein with FMN-binding domain